MKNLKSGKDLAEKFSKTIENIAKKNKNLNVFSFYEKWNAIIGDKNLAEKCELIDIDKNTIILKTSHSGWAQQLLMKKKAILFNMNKFYPELKISNITIHVEENLNKKEEFPFDKKKADNYFDTDSIDLNEVNEEKNYIDPKLDKALKNLKKSIIMKNKN